MQKKADNKLTHIDTKGKAKMVDVSKKDIVKREAKASGKIYLKKNTVKLIKENALKKGDVVLTARIAAIMAAKKTSDIIPLCHNIQIESINIEINIIEDLPETSEKKSHSNFIEVVATTICSEKTGIEMEALTAVSVSLLTIWDMCKAVDKSMKISDISLIYKKKNL